MTRFEMDPGQEESLQRQIQEALQGRIQAALDATIRAWRATDLKDIEPFLRHQLKEQGIYDLDDDWIANACEQIATGRIDLLGSNHDRPAHGD